MSAEFRNCEAMLCAFRNFITDRTSQSAGAGIRASIFNSWNAATVKTQEVPLVHAPCYSIALWRMRSRFARYKVFYLWDKWETYFADALRRIAGIKKEVLRRTVARQMGGLRNEECHQLNKSHNFCATKSGRMTYCGSHVNVRNTRTELVNYDSYELFRCPGWQCVEQDLQVIWRRTH
jgi:hypothetical protein